jgi:hypothetical protein
VQRAHHCLQVGDGYYCAELSDSHACICNRGPLLVVVSAEHILQAVGWLTLHPHAWMTMPLAAFS